MRPRVRLALALALVTLGAALPAQAQQDTSAARRAHLERMVLTRFLDRTAAQVGMSDTQRTRIEEILRAGAERNRDQRQQATRLRRELVLAVADDATSDAEFERLLAAIEQLRVEEQQAWQRDQDAIAAVLSPRQRAIFSVRWLELQENVREIIGQRGARRGMPRPPPR
jgi:Spy/CpxP family protein refolding chaperone